MKHTHRMTGGLHYMVGAAFFFSVMSLFVKVLGQRLPTAEIVFVRSAVVLFLVYFLVRRARIGIWGNRKALLVLRGLVGFAALFCFFYAVPRLPLADITVIHFTNPVFTALMASLFLNETLGRNEVLGLMLCLIGVTLVVQPAFLFGHGAKNLDLFVVSIALLASVLSSMAYATVRKLGETDHYLVVVFYFPLISTPASIPLLVGRTVWPTAIEWLLLIGVGIVTLIAQVFLTKGLHREKAGRAMSMSYVQVVFAAVWGVLFFNEVPNLLGVGGAMLIFAGMLLAGGGFGRMRAT